MELSLAALLLSVVSATISIVSLLRTRKTAELNAQFQSRGWRQSVLKSVIQLSRSITQAEVQLQRETKRVSETLDLVEQTRRSNAASPEVLDKLVERIEVLRQTINEKNQMLADTSVLLDRMWEIENPGADLDAALQRMATRIANTVEVISEVAKGIDSRHEVIEKILSNTRSRIID